MLSRMLLVCLCVTGVLLGVLPGLLDKDMSSASAATMFLLLIDKYTAVVQIATV